MNARRRARPLVAGLVAILAAGCAGGSGRPPARASGATTTVARSALTTTAPGPPQVPVVGCHSSYGVPPPVSRTTLPPVLTVDLPRATADQLSYYTNDTRTLTPLLGLRSWNCQVQVGADGTTGFDIWPAGSSGANGQPGVDAAADSACQGCVYSTVCAFVPAAATQLGYAGLPCPALGKGTTVDFIKGSASEAGPVVDDVIGFTLPTVPTSTRGVVLYHWRPGVGASASEETCNLPAMPPELCTAILHAFVVAAWLLRT